MQRPWPPVASRVAGLPEAGISRRQVLMLAPLGVAAAAGVGFWSMLSGMGSGRFDPHDIHAPAVNRHVPDFFASWCIPCVLEAQTLAGLGRVLPVWGIAYKDHTDNAAGFVTRTGNPYARLAADTSGLSAIDWGVSGVPESFLVLPGGLIRWHVAGPLTPEIIDGGLLPALRGASR